MERVTILVTKKKGIVHKAVDATQRKCYKN